MCLIRTCTMFTTLSIVLKQTQQLSSAFWCIFLVIVLLIIFNRKLEILNYALFSLF